VASSAPQASRPKYDVFLAYNSADEDAVSRVSAINGLLRDSNKHPWYDKADSLRGESGQKNMADAINQSGCLALFVGAAGLGRHQGRLELPTAVRKAINQSDFRIVPVLLPGYTDKVGLPDEIADRTVEDLRTEFDLNGQLTLQGRNRLLAFIAKQTPTEFEEAAADTLESGSDGSGPANGPTPPRERFRALLVGVSSYDNPGLDALRGPQHDVDALGLALEELAMPLDSSWAVEPLYDPTKDELSDAIQEFFAANTAEDDTLLFYFSGHAVVSSGSHLCARDSDPEQPWTTCITGQMLVEAVKRASSRYKVIVLDCCHAVPLADDHNPYLRLDDHTAVLFASRGPAHDAPDDIDTSPFTGSLVRVLRDDQLSGEEGLTVGVLLDALMAQDQHPQANPRIARGIQLGAGAAPSAAKPETEVEHAVLEVDGAGVSENEERMLRQLAAILDAFLAFVPEDGRIPKNVVAQTVHVLAEDLRRHVPRFEHEIGQSLPTESDDPLPVDLRFKDKEVRKRLGDLPWEYISMCRFGDEQRPPDPVRSPALTVQRVFPAGRTKSSQSGRVARAPGLIQRVAVFSSLAPPAPTELQHLLTRLTTERLVEAKFKPEVTAPADWRRFRSFNKDADVFILQVPVYLEGKQAQVRWRLPSGEEDTTTPIEDLGRVLEDRPALTWLLIESVAEQADADSALAVRQAAEYLALKLELPVLAVCHSMAYLNYLREDDLDGPFAAQVVERLNRGEPLDIAANAVRRDLMTALSPKQPAIIGVPIVLSPDRRAATGRSAGQLP
jgi:hypothetical protein